MEETGQKVSQELTITKRIKRKGSSELVKEVAGNLAVGLNQCMAQDLLKESEERFRLFFEEAVDGMFLADLETKQLAMSNPQIRKMLGYSADELKLMKVSDIHPTENITQILKTFESLVRGEIQTAVEQPVKRKDGSIFYADISAKPVEIDGWQYLIGFFHDVTERKQAEELLQKSLQASAFLADLIECSSQPFSVGYPDGRLGLCNDAYAQLLGYSKAELAKIDWVGITPPEWLGIERKHLEKLHKTGRPVRYEKEYIRKDGSRVPIELLVHLKRDESGQPMHYFAFITDISERKEAQRTLQENEVRFRELFENMSDCVAVYEAIDDGEDFIFKNMNSAGERIEKTQRAAIIGKRVTEVFPGVRDFGLFEVFKRVWKTGKPEHCPVSLYKDERLAHWVENYVYKLPSGEIVAVYEDMTEQKQAEIQMIAYQNKLKSLASQLVLSEEQQRKKIESWPV